MSGVDKSVALRLRMRDEKERKAKREEKA